MIKRFFITGTDTNIGKTIASSAIIQSIVSNGYLVAGYKPVSSGCKITSEGKISHDTKILISSSNVLFTYDQVNPLSFLEPNTPYISSINIGKYININELSNGLKIFNNFVDWLIIEGAGGWFTPLGKKLTYADWVVFENLPVILVIGLKLGCINHALLTSSAIRYLGINLVGWIANNLVPSSNQSINYIKYLKEKLCIPLLGEIPYLDPIRYDNLSQYIDISSL